MPDSFLHSLAAGAAAAAAQSLLIGLHLTLREAGWVDASGQQPF